MLNVLQGFQALTEGLQGGRRSIRRQLYVGRRYQINRNQQGEQYPARLELNKRIVAR